MKRIFVTLSLLASVVAVSAKPVVSVKYVTLDEASVSANPVKEYSQEKMPSRVGGDVRLYPEIKFQEMVGLGGCFNEIGGEALVSLSKKAQMEVLDALFGADKSAFEYCRAAIGSSDFGIDAYSFSEVAEDYEMKHFSLKRDKKYMLPFMQKAVKLNPELKIFGSPWSPPGWMKYSGYIDRGSEFRDKNFLRDEPKIYEAYALYFLKYVEEYRKAGVNIDRILIQNEQDFHTKYPSCRMPVEQMSKFVKGYMRPLFDKEKVETEIWAGTFRTAGEQEALRLAASKEYREDFDGVGIQYTGGQSAFEIKYLAPEMKLMHTESVCYNGDNSWAQARRRFGEISGYINSGCENFSYWNMILNETGQSGWGWKQNSLININRDTKEVTYNPDYSVFTLMSRAIRSGDVRMAYYSRLSLIALTTSEGYTIVMQNDKKEDQKIKFMVGDESFEVVVPATSLSAIEVEL